MAKKVGAHSPMKMPQRSARATPARSRFLERNQLVKESPMLANPAR